MPTFRQQLDPIWHGEEAVLAEEAGDWFASAFHLGRLLPLQKGDPVLHLRRSRACRQLDRPFAAWMHNLAARSIDPNAKLPAVPPGEPPKPAPRK